MAGTQIVNILVLISQREELQRIQTVWYFDVLARQLPLQEAFPGLDFSASGLQAVALVFEEDTRKMEISNLLDAPLLESLELEFESVSELELSAEISVQRHDKPFRFTLASRDSFYLSSDESSHGQPLAWQTLEEGFGPQQYRQCLDSDDLLHQTLLNQSQSSYLQVYCNAAHTRAVKAKRSRQPWALPSCEFRLRTIGFFCEDCDADHPDQMQFRSESE